MAIPVTINGRQQQLDVPNEMPLLWAIREVAGLTGTKYACGVAQCGACTVHLDGQPVRACVTPTSAARGRRVTTIEGLDAKGEHPLQKAWVDEQVPQCGYCQSGQIMSAAALLAAKPNPTDADIDSALAGNICRCGTYQRIRAAIHKAAAMKTGGAGGGRSPLPSKETTR
jgi:isoquinoline 1-oxidoreductase alpha subunit